MLVKAIVPELPHDIAILPSMRGWLIGKTMLRAGVVKHRFHVERFAFAERWFTVALATVVPSVGIGHQI